ncbi:MAG: hypothetical protein SVM80_12045 [Halobacteriota archaeon]|nr:hypothetical protein [Halobacteriota archaeon]
MGNNSTADGGIMITTESVMWEICYDMSEEMRGKWMFFRMNKALKGSQSHIIRFLQFEDLEKRRVVYDRFCILFSDYISYMKRHHPEAAWLLVQTRSAMRMEIEEMEEMEEKNERENRYREHLNRNSQ